jgi:exo-beta-1,3-glucanase (GH17 family)
MYDPYAHASTVLKLIHKHQIDLKVMLGVEPKGEISNPNCKWGGIYSEEEIKRHQIDNFKQLDVLLKLAEQYENHILALSVGNECTSDWHGNLMPESSLIEHVKYLRKHTKLPITFNEGTYFWQTKCRKLSEYVDFISIHSYPVWVKIPHQDAFEYTKNDYLKTKELYPNKPIIFTEVGWPTKSDGPMIIEETNEIYQKSYLEKLVDWGNENQVIMFLFEAFDEPWKGSNRPDEPEKHWGLWFENRSPKSFAQSRYKNSSKK